MNGEDTAPRKNRSELCVEMAGILIAAGALKEAHGDDWKHHATVFPEDLTQEDA